MAVQGISHEISFGRMRIFVIADKGTHHSTIAKAVWQYVKEQDKPVWHDALGKWCFPRFDGFWQALGDRQDMNVRKTFTSWPVPADSEDTAH